MIRTDKTIVVEGKYDIIKLSALIDGVLIPTGGFAIFQDKEKQALLRTLAEKTGLIILTDSDNAGFRIRRFIHNICGGKNVADAYIPDLYGKEKRKDKPSKEGKLGVEGVPLPILEEALRRAGALCSHTQEPKRPITKLDLYQQGLSGGENSSAKRTLLLKRLNLPEHLTTNSIVTILNALLSWEDFQRLCAELFGEKEERPIREKPVKTP